MAVGIPCHTYLTPPHLGLCIIVIISWVTYFYIGYIFKYNLWLHWIMLWITFVCNHIAASEKSQCVRTVDKWEQYWDIFYFFSLSRFYCFPYRGFTVMIHLSLHSQKRSVCVCVRFPSMIHCPAISHFFFSQCYIDTSCLCCCFYFFIYWLFHLIPAINEECI